MKIYYVYIYPISDIYVKANRNINENAMIAGADKEMNWSHTRTASARNRNRAIGVYKTTNG